MTTIMPKSELMRRAAAFVAERFSDYNCGCGNERPPEAAVMSILDEAGMRFNLSPADSAALFDLFHSQS